MKFEKQYIIDHYVIGIGHRMEDFNTEFALF